jgi:hypothetical protein
MQGSQRQPAAQVASHWVDWVAPGLTLVVCVFCFGILLARQGYFQDDWHHVFYAFWQGPLGLQKFLLTDRGPFAWPVYAGLFSVLGFSPSAWHWALMFTRLLTVLVFWLSIRRVWPGGGNAVAWFGPLFCIYPVFTLQPLAVAYALHWLMFLVFSLSLLLMLEAQRHPRQFLLLTIGSVVLQVTHLAQIEYFAGLELARPIFVWLLLTDLAPRERVKQALRRTLPYLLILAVYVAYRSSFAVIFGYDRFDTLGTLAALAHSPWAGMGRVLQVALQDILYLFVSPWHSAVDPALIDLSRPSTYLIFGSLISIAVLAYSAFVWSDRHREHSGERSVPAEMIVAGLATVVLAMLPFWLTGFSIYQKNQLWSERLALAAMPGASLAVVGTVFLLVSRMQYRHAVLAILLGMGVSLHVQNARAFQASSDKQQQFYWQLTWRAPSLKAGTLLVADQEILFFMGIYPTAFAVNLLYPQITPPPEASYWFNAGFEHMDFDRFAAGTPDAFEKYATTFSAEPEKVVSITFEPGDGQCLWVLRPELINAGGLRPAARTWLTISNPQQIEASQTSTPPRPIFGPEPRRSWCYYFEKADLARQYRDWPDIQQLWHDAQAAGLRAENGVELAPFIEAFAREGNWSEAQAITRAAQSMPDRSTSLFCDVWRDLDLTMAPTADHDQATADMQDALGCQPWR